MANGKKKTVTTVEEPAKVTAAEEIVTDAANAVAEVPVTEKPAKRTRKCCKTAEASAAPVEEKPAAKRTPAKKAAPAVNVVVQIMGKEATPEDMVARAKADWEAQGHSVSEIQNLAVYLNAAEGKVYYVVNDNGNSGSFAF
ncbi:MAG: DUF6465 family protein [Oscillospiraceae bacterium]|nr:DUF6465 family protein [Oscillospiraceae bacterium]